MRISPRYAACAIPVIFLLLHFALSNIPSSADSVSLRANSWDVLQRGFQFSSAATETSSSWQRSADFLPNPNPNPKQYRFMGRYALPVAPRGRAFKLPGWFLNEHNGEGRARKKAIIANRQTRVMSSPLDCSGHCSNMSAFCQVWVFNLNKSLCSVYDFARLQTALTPQRAWYIGGKNFIAGAAQQLINVWSDPTCSLSLSKRSLLIVNWHHPTSGREIMRYHVVHGPFVPPCTDIVHVTPNILTGTLWNVWSTAGLVSYLSILLSWRLLPGYQGYMLTNDDVVILWPNLPLNYSTWSWATPFLDRFPPFHNTTWPWKYPSSHPYCEADVTNWPSNNWERTQRALSLLTNRSEVRAYGPTADFFYIAKRDVDFADLWLSTHAQFGCFLEFVVPNMYAFLERGFKSIDLIEASRSAPWTSFNMSSRAAVVHPVKLSNAVVLDWMLNSSWADVMGLPWDSGTLAKLPVT